VAPANKAFGRFWTTVFLQFFIGFHEFLQVFDCFSTGCGEAASSKTWFCYSNQNIFFAKTSSKPGFDTSTSFFQGFG
jgi:hypothetical protein